MVYPTKLGGTRYKRKKGHMVYAKTNPKTGKLELFQVPMKQTKKRNKVRKTKR